MLLVDEGQNQGTNLVNGGTASASSIPFIASNIAIINDETRQKQLLQEDEEEDFLDEGTYTNTRYNLLKLAIFLDHRWRLKFQLKTYFVCSKR